MKRFIAIFMTLCLMLGLSSVSVWADETGTNDWQTKMIMPIVPQRAFGTCTIGDKIYVMGRENTSVTVYDTKTDSWKMGTPMQKKSYGIKAITVGNKIYTICNGGSLNSFMQIYDFSTDTWSVKEDITYRSNLMNDLTLTAIGDKIYLTYTYQNHACISAYDTVSGEWFSGKAPTSVKSNASCVKGNDIYLIGSDSRRKSDKVLEVYDTTTDTWKTLSKLPTTREDFSVAMVGNKIYVMGGENAGYLNTVEVYDIETNTWTIGVPLKTPRKFMESAVVGEKIYLLAGWTKTTTNSNLVESLQVGNTSDVLSAKLSVLLNVDETVQLSTSYNLQNNANYTWSSADEAVATVDNNGKVTAVAVGEADIYAENADGTFKEYIPVKVVEGIADELRLAVHLKSGEKAKLYLTDDPSQVTWSSLDDSVATISTDGQVTGVKKGLAIIQAELNEQTYQIYVRVNG